MPRFLAVAVAVLVAVPLFAQDLESFAGLRVRFDAPGARSAAMGGASEALSDPFGVATNPASLAQQRKRLLSIESREVTNDTDFVTSGTIGSFTTNSFETKSRGVRAATLIVPTATSTWALFYDEPLSLSADTLPLIDGSNRVANFIGVSVRNGQLVPLNDCIDAVDRTGCGLVAYFSAPALSPANGTLRLRRYGAATARSFGSLSLGVSAQYAQLDEEFGTAGAGETTHGRQLTWNAGLQYALTSRVRFGASYRGGATYDGERVTAGPYGQEPPRAPSQFRTPASYATGLAADITPNFTLAADAVRVNYSDTLRRDFNFTDRPAEFGGPIFYELPDVTELRAGAEYRLRTRVPVALRAGWWREDAHRVQAVSGDPAFAATINAVLLLDQDENHVTAGIGIGDRVRLDAAYARSENTSRASVGLATSF